MSRRARLVFGVFFSLIGCALACAQEAASPPPVPAALPLPATQPTGDRPVPQIDRAIVISIDGLRSDVLLRADAPNLRQLMARGTFSFWARTTDIAITLPSHCSMLTGVPPEKHGIFWNDKVPPGGPDRPSYPTLLELAHAAGYSTAIAAGKGKFAALAPGTDWSSVPTASTTRTTAVAAEAVRIVREHRPQVLFVHLPGTDNAGHRDGWGTPQQLAEVKLADDAVGQILAAVRDAGDTEHTFVLISSDHGGAGRTHGKDDPRSRFIPWIVAGPGIRGGGYDLTREKDLNVRTEDTFATACWLLGLVPPRPVDGRSIKAILPPGELLQPAPTTAPSAQAR